MGREHQRDSAWPRPSWQLLEVAGQVVRAGEISVACPQERHDDFQGLLEPLVDVIFRQAERVGAGPRVTSPETKDEPTRADLVDRLGRLRGDTWVAMEGRHHPGPDLDLRGSRRKRRGDGDPVPETEDRTARCHSPEELVGAPDRVEPELLGTQGLITDLGPADRARILAGSQRSEDDTHFECPQRILHEATAGPSLRVASRSW